LDPLAGGIRLVLLTGSWEERLRLGNGDRPRRLAEALAGLIRPLSGPLDAGAEMGELIQHRSPGPHR